MVCILPQGERTARKPYLSQRVYLSLAIGEDMPLEYLRWKLAEQFGWSLEYIDQLSIQTIHEYLQVEDGKMRASHSILRG